MSKDTRAGLIGVVAALLIFQAPLGFVAILGITALSGMIMRNSVILSDQVRGEMERGLDSWNAVLEAAIHRHDCNSAHEFLRAGALRSLVQGGASADSGGKCYASRDGTRHMTAARRHAWRPPLAIGAGDFRTPP